MEIGGPAWDEARRAWRRLAARQTRRSLGGDEALATLSDIRVVRWLLDQGELTAVRAARVAGRPWAEIAMNLGITRQSAWERWRELDEQPAEPAEQARATAAQHLAASATSAVAVPDVIGLGVDDAGRVLHDAGFVAGEHNPGGPITPLRAGQGSTVVDQVPRGGARRRRGSTVALWLERGGGGAGVREPRRPKPDPRAAREVRDIG